MKVLLIDKILVYVLKGRVVFMKKLKRILAILLAAAMVFSVFGCSTKTTTKEEETTTVEPSSEEPTTEDNKGDDPTGITINLHYLREDGAYDGWSVWFWVAGVEGTDNPFGTEADDKGVVCTKTFPAGSESVGFIVRTADWQKDWGEDQFIDLKGILAGTVDVYVNSGVAGYTMEKGADCVTGLGVASATLQEDYLTVKVTMTEAWTEGNTLAIKDKDGKVIETTLTADSSDDKKVVLKFASKVDEFGTYTIVLNDSFEYAVNTPDFYSTEAFESKYTYTGNDLGANWTKAATTFKVWAPTAEKVVVNLYKSGTKGTKDLIKSVDMTMGDKGVWSVKVDGDLNKTYYTYSATVQGVTKEVCDPYAKTTGVNGERAMVIDMASTNPTGWDKDVNPNKGMEMTDAIIYELHVRDLSIDSSSGIKNAGKYLGLTELNTKNANGTLTGLSHMKDLGITHLHLNPVYDYATVDETKLDTPQFNWGYDPKNYNTPEGSYSTDPYNGEVRVKEFKQMVQALHNNGISVVMDVVYNHTYSSTEYCYNGIVPGYFHRPGSNGSGCGNDVASERAMVRKYIVESCVYWAKEYHVDGFRFDLVGLIDTETIKQIRTELDKIDPSIILYGEGWSLTTKATKPGVTMATQSAVKTLEGFAMFNDTIRDGLKGSVFNKTEKGYVNGELSKTTTIKKAITGSVAWSSTPAHMVNYSCCHDNYTLWDEIAMSNGEDTESARLHQNLLSAAVVFTSQGVPFILAGEEFLRSKPKADGTFDHNSYSSPDSVNSMKWNTLDDASNKIAYKYYKGLIEFRKAHASLSQMKDATKCYTFTDGLANGVIAYSLAKADGEVSDGIFVIHNATTNDVKVDLPEGNWTICIQGENAGNTSLGTASGSVTVSGISTTVLVKGALK